MYSHMWLPIQMEQKEGTIFSLILLTTTHLPFPARWTTKTQGQSSTREGMRGH